jgi:3-phenylpropionate/trans-cinnamate dioxygenase ferredoxin reductase subunit
MSNKCTLTVNGQMIEASRGETLLDAALRGRVIIPQDCCTGQCNTCRVQVLSGEVDDQGTAINDMVLGCCSTLEGDAAIIFDPVPQVVKRNGEISSIRYISPEIMEVLLQMPENFEYLAGQYVNLSFAGFPGRDYSPTAFENGDYDPRTLVFHIKRYEGGLISTAFNSKIKVGHKVKVTGPYGHAFYREGQGRLILVSSGTGFAPIWSVAREAILSNPNREIMLVVGTRHAANLYMGQSLIWLAEQGVKNITICASGSGFGGVVQKGRPTYFIPDLRKGDIVYAAGTPEMVTAVTKMAESANVTVYADPFTMNHTGLSVFNRIVQAIHMPSIGDVLSPRPTNSQPSYKPVARPVAIERSPSHMSTRPRQQNNESLRVRR